MKTIDILFDEIDKINFQIKSEEHVLKKISLALQIKKIVEIINDIWELKIQSGNDECV